MDKALYPLSLYLAFFSKIETFINIDIDEHVSSKITVIKKDAENTEIELPSVVDLNQVTALLNYHQSEYTTHTQTDTDRQTDSIYTHRHAHTNTHTRTHTVADTKHTHTHTPHTHERTYTHRTRINSCRHKQMYIPAPVRTDVLCKYCFPHCNNLIFFFHPFSLSLSQ